MTCGYARHCLARLCASLCVAPLCALFAACSTPPPAAARPAHSTPSIPRELRYTFGFDATLRTLSVRLCFEGAPPKELVCGVRWARQALLGAYGETTGVEGGLRALTLDGDRISLAGVPPNACIRYQVDLGAVAERRGALSAELRDGGLMSNLALWLWRPPRHSGPSRATARFELPAGVSVSVPWPREGDHYRLDETAFRYLAYGVVGRYELEQVEVPGATIEIAVLPGLPAATRAHVSEWIEAAGLMASLPGGRFPRSHALVVVVPAPPSDKPVGFGQVVRGGGASVGIFLHANAAQDVLVADWVAVHEFSHLWHPFVERGDAWLSEGLATYYQEVLRARAGLTTEAYAWQRLWTGAEYRAGARGSLAEESAEMFRSFAFRRVYWAGAAFALMADVELRRRTSGHKTLDGILEQLAECCAGGPPQPARKLIARMDQIAGVEIFRPLYERWVLGPELPKLRELYQRLGLEVSAGRVRHAAGARDAWIRDAIMQRDKAVAARIAEATARTSAHGRALW